MAERPQRPLTLLFLTCVLSLGVLIWSASSLVSSCTRLANTFHIPPALIGLTVIAFGTSAPELVVSLDAAFRGHGGLITGNVIGSNITNASLGLGAGMLVLGGSLVGNARFGWALLATTLLVSLMLWDGQLSRLEAWLLVLMLVPAVYMARHWMMGTDQIPLQDPVESGNRLHLLLIPLALALLLISAELLVWTASQLALSLGTDQHLIGLTLLALGTSLPEISTVLAASQQRQPALVLSSLVGSNFFNLVTVMGLSGTVLPLEIPADSVLRDLPIMVLTTLALVAVSIRPLRTRAARWAGAALCLVYLGYLTLLARQTAVENLVS